MDKVSHHAGFLLVIEGIDGAGKSTIVRRLAEFVRSLSIPNVVSREPTNGPHGTALRQSALSGRLTLEEELELFLKDRQEHVESLIRPALARGEVVILDRYYFSTAAYQGARGANPEEIIRRNEVFAPMPDLVLLLDLDPGAGRDRISERGTSPDAFEGETYQREVRKIFLSLDRPFIRRIDASRSADEVFEDCVAALQQVMGKSKQ